MSYQQYRTQKTHYNKNTTLPNMWPKIRKNHKQNATQVLMTYNRPIARCIHENKNFIKISKNNTDIAISKNFMIKYNNIEKFKIEYMQKLFTALHS